MRWAGLMMGAAAGLLLGVSVALLRHYRRRRRALEEGWELGPRRPIFAALLITAAFLGPLVGLGARASVPDPPSAPRVTAEPDASQVESVVFLLGDGGNARQHLSPILPRVRADVERWSGRLERDSAVVVLFLGDNVYPSGLPEQGSLTWAGDSAKVADQASLVAGPLGRKRGARAIFLAGNHDWGHEADWAGALRLVRLGEFLDSWTGPAAGRLTMSPEPGTGGPGIVDLGRGVRLVLLDTAWWLLGADPPGKDEVIEGLREALRSAAGRRVIVAAHHPLRSAGPHGVAEELGRTFGVRFLLQKAGLLLQDLTSPPYADLRARLGEVFSDAGRPDIFAGGHEHSLQVFGLEATPVPRDLVVGSASKLTKVRNAPGLLFARSEPGYAKVFVLRDGGLHIRIEAAPARYLTCENATDLDACMADGVAAFRTVWAETLEARQELGE
jgi:hypothetical protein